MNKFEVVLDKSYNESVKLVREALSSQGFGVITEINVTEVLKKKLAVEDFKDFIILGACNPKMAHQALEVNNDIALLLPCNVVVHDSSEGIVVSSMQPSHMLSLLEEDKLCVFAEQVDEMMGKVFAELGTT